ncbi:hypothetical protein [uncultured Algibacter sp.]|uniref:hypothetical protein n=1 Tax=uncultured Algibacter sp. TaxID=298659 RepID=UPI002619B70D|nr:hypothetical protein [uncultured Algibacter sp.]
MSSIIKLFKIYFISFFSFCFRENVDTVKINNENSEFVSYNSKNDKIEKSTTIKSFGNTKSKVIEINYNKTTLSNLEVDSKIKVLYFRLRKNLDTLVYLSELEAQFENKYSLSKVIQQYNAIKKSIQVDTIEITNELSYYKGLKQNACA